MNRCKNNSKLTFKSSSEIQKLFFNYITCILLFIFKTRLLLILHHSNCDIIYTARPFWHAVLLAFPTRGKPRPRPSKPLYSPSLFVHYFTELCPNPVLTYRLVADGVFSILYRERLVFIALLNHGAPAATARSPSRAVPLPFFVHYLDRQSVFP